jgi:hypothetical protein
MSDRVIRNLRRQLDHPVRGAVVASFAVFVFGLGMFDGDLRPAIAGFVVTGPLYYWLWRPGGWQAARLTARIERQTHEPVGDGRIDWGPPKSPPTGGGS